MKKPRPISVVRLMLLVRDQSVGIVPGFAEAVLDAHRAGLIKPREGSGPRRTVPHDFVLTALGCEALDATGCTRKTTWITDEVYCAHHGRDGGWPCRRARLAHRFSA